MRPLLAFPQCGQVTPFGQRISSKYARALSSSLKIGSVRLTVIAGVLSARYSTYCIPFVKGIIGTKNEPLPTNRVVEIDQVVGRIGKEGRPAMRGGPPSRGRPAR